MRTTVPPGPGTGIAGLVAEALRGTGDIVRGEIALFRQEMADNLRKLAAGVAATATAAVFAIVGLLVLIDALVKALALVVGSQPLAALGVGVFLLGLALVLVLVARTRFSTAALMPTRTSRQIRQDAKVIKERNEA